MSFRQATPDELLSVFPQLQAYNEWNAMRSFVQETFGTNVVRATLITYGQYNDEGYDLEAHIEALDVQGHEVPINLSLPFFASFTVSDEQRQLFKSDNFFQELNGVEYSTEVADLAWDIEKMYQKRLHAVMQIPDAANGEEEEERKTFDFTAPPPLPTLYLATE